MQELSSRTPKRCQCIHFFSCAGCTSWWRLHFGGLFSTSDTEVVNLWWTLLSSLHPNTFPDIMAKFKNLVLTSKILSKVIFLWLPPFVSFSCLSNTCSARFPGFCPWHRHPSVGNACFSICRHYAGMKYQMTGFHLDIIYLLYQYFILKKVHQCEDRRENPFWLRDNLEIIKVKSLWVKG